MSGVDIAPGDEKPHRREYGSGTLREIRPKRWRLRAPGGVDKATGRTRQVSRNFHASKPANRGGRGEALEALRKLVAEVEEGQHVGTSANIARLAQDYLPHVKRTKEPGTYDSYRVRIEKTIVPALGSVKLSQLSAHHLDQLYTEMVEKGYASTTIEHTHNVISGMLTQAVRWGWLPANVAQQATPPKGRPKEHNAIAVTDAVRLIDGALELDEDPDMATLIFLLCLVGGRRGEAAGFQWGDVVWERRAIKVERQLVPCAKQDADPEMSHAQRVRPPKGGKKRVEAIGEVGVAVLVSYQAILRNRLGEGWKPSPTGWLVSIDGGKTPVRVHGVTDYVEGLGQRLLDAKGDPAPIEARPHDLRRFSVTQLIHHGIDLKTVRDRHGHSSLTTTETYALPVSESDAHAAAVMGSLLKRSKLLTWGGAPEASGSTTAISSNASETP